MTITIERTDLEKIYKKAVKIIKANGNKGAIDVKVRFYDIDFWVHCYADDKEIECEDISLYGRFKDVINLHMDKYCFSSLVQTTFANE